MAEDTSSVSKGCFLIKKSSVHAPRKRRAEDVFPDIAGENIAHRKQRYENYKKCWESIKYEIEVLQSQMNSKIFSDLLKFFKRTQRVKSSQIGRTSVTQEIPTAALITGVNMPDHDVIFSQLATELNSHVTPFVALLRSKDCTVMKATMKNVISQFIGCDVQGEDDLSPSEQTKKISNFTMPVLYLWYQKMIKYGYPKRKQSRQQSQFSDQPPLVVIFEDFEGFLPAVIQNFVMICSEYLSKLPLVLVFGIATAVTTVHKVLPHAVSSLLSIERFQSESSHVCVLEIISKVLMTARFPFKLGARVLRLLYENFLFHDFSLQNLARGLQFSLMEHFFESPLSVLCCVSSDGRKDLLNEMSHKQVEMFRKTKSFRRYVESEPPSRQLPLLLDDPFTKEVIAELLESFDQYHWSFFPVLHCLHILTCNLPRHPLGKKPYDVYENSLTSNIYEQDEYKEALSLLRVCSKDELLPLLNKCVDILGNAVDSAETERNCQKLKESRDCIAGLLKQFDKINGCGKFVVVHCKLCGGEDGSLLQQILQAIVLFSKTGEEESNLLQRSISKLTACKMGIQETQEKISSPKEALSTVTDRFELQKRLMSAAKQKKKESPYDKLRQKTVDAMDEMFRGVLICPRNMPLHEVIYYDKLHDTRKHLVGIPRVAIQTALSNPQHYLQCDCCQTDIGTVQDTLPDICIAYRLHLECGRLINLYDWFQAFTAVLEPLIENESLKCSPKKKQKMDEQLHARFIQAVSELQFLGFIKSTRQKTDHVQRLTWGTC